MSGQLLPDAGLPAAFRFPFEAGWWYRTLAHSSICQNEGDFGAIPRALSSV